MKRSEGAIYVKGHYRRRPGGGRTWVRPYTARLREGGTGTTAAAGASGVALLLGALAIRLPDWTDAEGTAAALLLVTLSAGSFVVALLRMILKRRRTVSPSQRLVDLAMLIGGGKRHWRRNEWAVDLAESPASVWLGAELVRAAIVMRLSDVGSWARRQLCKLLISEFRTWGVLVPILVLAFSDVIKSEGWGVAVFTIPTVVVIYEGVAWLRKRWGVHVRHSDRSDRSDEDA